MAEDFYRAAVRSHESAQRSPRILYDAVFYHLHTHSIELALKAFLRASGISIDDLRSEYSHRLTRILRKCIELKLKVRRPKRSFQAIEWLDELSKAQLFRYFEGGALTKPALTEVRELNERILIAVRPICVKPLLSDRE